MAGDGTVPQRRSYAVYARVGAMLTALCLMVMFAIMPTLSSEGLEAPKLDQLATTAPRGSGSHLRHARTPFDIVYMWVNGSETEYAANRAKFGGLKRVGDRDRDNNELRFSMRSLDMYMPWFTGTVHFVHQNVPCWLNVDHPRLNLVHHRQIFTDPDGTLPTFSSDAIEAHLHRIPGIQKHFLLMNDDFFLGRMTSMGDFLLANGDPVLYLEKYTVKGTKKDHLKLMRKGKKSWLSKIYHSKSLLVDHFGVSQPSRYHFLKHSPTLLDRDRMATLWRLFPKAIEHTVHSRFRRPDGLSMTWLHHHFCLLDPDSSCFVLPQALSDKEARFVKAGSADTSKLKAALESFDEGASPPKFFCINDEADIGKGRNQAGIDYAYRTFLPNRFPHPSQWETYACDMAA